MSVPSTERDELPDGLDAGGNRNRPIRGCELGEAYAASTTSLARKDSTSSLSGA
jgi:hypothetical protein